MPDVSVVVPSFNAAATIERCLGALRDQAAGASYEVVVVDSGTDGTDRLVAERFPEVRLLRLERRAFPGDARNAGVAAATGAILAFTDADCVPDAGWIAAIAAAHRRPAAVVGGVVANAERRGLAGWAYHFTEFHRWLPGRAAGPVDDMPACCWSMKRAAYDRWGPFLEGSYCSDTAFHWRMAADGERPRLDPSIAVAHRPPGRLGAVLAHETFHGRAFGRLRAAGRMSRAAAALRAVTSPALPLLLFARSLRSAATSPGHGLVFLRASPLTLLAMAAWSYGELRGYADAARAG